MGLDRAILPEWRIPLAFLPTGLLVSWQPPLGVGLSSCRSGSDEVIVREIVTVEERILELAPQLGVCAHGLLELQAPEASDPVAWEELFGQIEGFEHAKLSLIDGRIADRPDSDLFIGRVGFKALAQMKSGGWGGVTSEQEITWTRAREGDALGEWAIAAWEVGPFEIHEQPQPSFEESLEAALPDPVDFAKARRSVHQEASIRYYESGGRTEDQSHPYFAPISVNQKPGISVVDIDSDGDDEPLHHRPDGQ